MTTYNLLYKTRIDVNDKIHIEMPTVGQILEQESNYFGIVNMITSMPIDCMVQLDEMGIDFTQIDEYQLFLLMFAAIKGLDTSLVFGDLDISKFEIAENQNNGMIVLLDKENDIVIDKLIHAKMATILRDIHGLEANIKKAGNEEAKKYLIERARKKLKREQNKRQLSQLESLIIAMVNVSEFKYNYEEVLNLTIYQFNESVRQVMHKVDYDQKMGAVYAGTISTKDLSQEDMSWIRQIK